MTMESMALGTTSAALLPWLAWTSGTCIRVPLWALAVDPQLEPCTGCLLSCEEGDTTQSERPKFTSLEARCCRPCRYLVYSRTFIFLAHRYFQTELTKHLRVDQPHD